MKKPYTVPQLRGMHSLCKPDQCREYSIRIPDQNDRIAVSVPCPVLAYENAFRTTVHCAGCQGHDFLDRPCSGRMTIEVKS